MIEHVEVFLECIGHTDPSIPPLLLSYGHQFVWRKPQGAGSLKDRANFSGKTGSIQRRLPLLWPLNGWHVVFNVTLQEFANDRVLLRVGQQRTARGPPLKILGGIPNQSETKSVKGPCRRTQLVWPQTSGDAIAKFLRGLATKSQYQDAISRRSGFDASRNSLNQGGGLSGSRSGQNQQRASARGGGMVNSALLFSVRSDPRTSNTVGCYQGDDGRICTTATTCCCQELNSPSATRTSATRASATRASVGCHVTGGQCPPVRKTLVSRRCLTMALFCVGMRGTVPN